MKKVVCTVNIIECIVRAWYVGSVCVCTLTHILTHTDTHAFNMVRYYKLMFYLFIFTYLTLKFH